MSSLLALAPEWTLVVGAGAVLRWEQPPGHAREQSDARPLALATCALSALSALLALGSGTQESVWGFQRDPLTLCLVAGIALSCALSCLLSLHLKREPEAEPAALAPLLLASAGASLLASASTLEAALLAFALAAPALALAAQERTAPRPHSPWPAWCTSALPLALAPACARAFPGEGWWLGGLLACLAGLAALRASTLPALAWSLGVLQAGALLQASEGLSSAHEGTALLATGGALVLTQAGLWALVRVQGAELGQLSFSGLRGLGGRNPALAAAWCLLLASALGAPGTLAFHGRLAVLHEGVRRGEGSGVLLICLGTLLALAAVGRALWRLSRPLPNPPHEPLVSAPSWTLTATGGAALGLLLTFAPSLPWL